MQLIPLDVTNSEHIDFTYEILQARFNADFININKTLPIPSMEQHLEYLNSDRYKYYYIINVGDINIGTMYVLRENTQLGFFVHAQRAVKYYKTIKKILSYSIAETTAGDYPVKKITYLISKLALDKLIELHRDELRVLTSRVCYDNKKSRECTEFVLKFKPKYVYYEYDIG